MRSLARWLTRTHCLPLVRFDGDNWWVALNLQFEPGDLWVGLFVRRSLEIEALHVYHCVVPTLPLHATVKRHGGYFQ